MTRFTTAAVLLLALISCPASLAFFKGLVTFTDFFYRSGNGYGYGYTTFGASSCENLVHRPGMGDSYYMDWVSITNIGCIKHYSQQNCQGTERTMGPGYAKYQYSNAPKSFRGCDRDISQTFPFVDARVKLYKDANYEVLFEDKILASPECRTLPFFFQREVSSVKIPFCLNFYDAPSCSGNKRVFDKGEYRWLGDSLNFNDKLVSYEPCNPHDVFKNPKLNTVLEDSSEEVRRAQQPVRNWNVPIPYNGYTSSRHLSWKNATRQSPVEISLFKQTNFQDQFLSITQIRRDNTCHDLPREKVGWVKSIQSDVCLVLFSSESCNARGNNKFEYKLLPNSREAADLPRDLRRVRSLRLCKEEQRQQWQNKDSSSSEDSLSTEIKRMFN